MLAGHFTTRAGISKRERGREGGREGMKREITSHPTPSLLNYNNLTHMGWLLWQSEGEREREREREGR